MFPPLAGPRRPLTRRSLPVPFDRAYFDCSAEKSGANSRSALYRSVDAVGFEDDEAADGFLDRDVGAVGVTSAT
jgi:hypothetical protein